MSRRSASEGIVVVVGIDFRRCGEMVAWEISAVVKLRFPVP